MSYPLSYPPATSLMRRAGLCAAAFLIAAGFACAQSAPSQDQLSATGSSSSLSGLTQYGDLSAFEAPAISAAAEGGGQYGNGGGYGGGGKRKFLHDWTFEAGGGFSAPMGNDTPYITWGGNFTGGGGVRFSNRISLLAEYQFMDNKLPGAFIAALGQGASGGNAHINSITGSPVIDLFPKKSNGIYLVGGWGWYHKSTNFNVQVCCDFYGYPVTVNTNSFSSNQWGGNGGIGIYHRLGGMYGDSKTKLFAEARYTYIHTPPIGQENGLGTTELIPVTLGLRF